MRFENMVGKDFQNVSQRVIYSIIASFDEFQTITTKEADDKSQKQMYDFLWNFAISIYNDPSILKLPLDKDECEDRTADSKHYLETRKIMRKISKQIEDFYTMLMDIGQTGIK